MSSSRPKASEHLQIELSPTWLARLIGARAACLISNGLGKVILTDGRSGVKTDITDWVPSWERILLINSFSITRERNALRYWGMSDETARSVYDWLVARLIEHNEPDIRKTARKIVATIRLGYLRASRLEVVREISRELLSRLPNGFDQSLVSRDLVRDVELIQRFGRFSAKDARNYNRNFVRRRLAEHKCFFDSVETNPLTEKQREACVVDEDNNLVIAGAGSGKTSTIVGRVGYLLRSQQAKPSEILLLAFGSDAAKEVDERIRSKLGTTAVVASTFHKLGKEIIARVEGSQPSISRLATQPLERARLVQGWFERRLASDAEYKHSVISYFEKHMYPSANPFEFDSEGEYFDFIKANNIVTLKGEVVKSLGECLVANQLFKLGVDYVYENQYEHPTQSPKYVQYRPDFFLPQSGIYIEYYGIDKNGNTAPYVDRESYHNGIQWKREVHNRHGTRLIELYHYQLMDGSLIDSIKEELTQSGVQLLPILPEAFLETIREVGAIESTTKLLCELVALYRSAWFSNQQLEIKINESSDPDRTRAMLNILRPIVSDYEKELDREGAIDFDDMIGRAIRYVQGGLFRGPWRTILIDEFQDISEPRARLVASLRNSRTDCSLFCVGDDWQAIFGFAGSDVSLTTDFERHFGPTEVTYLDMNFRCNSSICDLSSQFVAQNPAQTKKEVMAWEAASDPSISLVFGPEEQNLQGVLRAIERLAPHGKPSVLILARFRHLLSNARLQGRAFPSLAVVASTVHQSKGMESDYVVILGLTKGEFGFPSEKKRNPLLEVLCPVSDDYPYSEERRLFYVALTRARHKVFLLTDLTSPSGFVLELMDGAYEIITAEFEIAPAQRAARSLRCPKCTTGRLVVRASAGTEFVGCLNFPLCNFTTCACPICSQIMRPVGDYLVCVAPTCEGWVPICTNCGAYMVKRRGSRGDFWGCSNYRGNEENSCRNGQNNFPGPHRERRLC